jgi:hypothetical protein
VIRACLVRHPQRGAIGGRGLEAHGKRHAAFVHADGLLGEGESAVFAARVIGFRLAADDGEFGRDQPGRCFVRIDVVALGDVETDVELRRRAPLGGEGDDAGGGFLRRCRTGAPRAATVPPRSCRGV